MSNRRPSRRQIEALSNETGPEDGVDPRYLRDPEATARRPGRKTQQLCSQVARTLLEVFAASPDLVLLDLEVVRVTPAGGGRLLVRVQPALSAAPRSSEHYSAHLAQAHSHLRQEVAHAIHRRKAPDLVFEFVERSPDESGPSPGLSLL